MSGASFDPERWRVIKQLFNEAASRPPAERGEFLAGACPDPALRHEVESLLSKGAAADEYFEGYEPTMAALASSAVSLSPAAFRPAAGRRLGPYEILAPIGAGGMGQVYRARDTKLGREVALKFLSGAFVHDHQRLARFRREAQILAALNHPNIGAIYSLEELEGTQFLVLELVDGASLDKRLARGRVPVDEALTIADEIAGALQAAHEKGIIHRDLKPANIALTTDGQAKVLDFGLATTSTSAETARATQAPTVAGAHTQVGAIIGTAAYMSPEQASGRVVDHRTDVWAFGCVLYELLTGGHAFGGATTTETITAILERQPDWQKLPAATPPDLRRLVASCLEKDRDKRPTMEIVRRMVSSVRSRARRRRYVAVAAAVIVVAGAAAGWFWNRTAQTRWAREQAIPEVMRLAEHDAYPAAYALAERAARALPAGDPTLAELWPHISTSSSLLTDPPGASVFMKEYGADDSTWKLLGQSPLENVRLPMGVFEWRVEKAGFEPMRLASPNPSVLLRNLPAYPSLTLELRKAGSVPAGMVPIPGGNYPVRLTGFNPRGLVGVETFFIDRNEVTNREFKAFIDRGGYEKPEYWVVPDGGTEAPIADAIRNQFHDTSGKPGPSTWELGDYPRGRDEYPVAGVSWYEALAYCRANGKTLPTIFHWSRAAMSPGEHLAPLLPAVIPRSNFASKGLVPVSSLGGVGPYGTFDMGGNVREWAWNKTGDNRWLLGGSWDQPTYMYTVSNNAPPGDRSPTNGFRCALYRNDQVPQNLSGPIELRVVNYRTAPAVSDEVFQTFRQRFSYDRTPLNARTEATDAGDADWITEKVSLDTGYGGERIPVYLTIPKAGTPPFQIVVAFPGLGPFQNRGGVVPYGDYDFIVKSHRALVQPVFKGSYERWDGFMGLVGEEYARTFRERVVQWYQDLGRTLDYLATRREFTVDRVAFTGLSFGASIPLPLLAVEPRVKAAVLLSAGFSELRLPPEADPINYVSRIKIPIVMVGGRYDYVLPLEIAQRPLFERFGTPPADKKHAVLEAGHTPLPRGAVVRETLEWLDRYLGPAR
jgi:eukaryotic-like serine/threonine-protein kinase